MTAVLFGTRIGTISSVFHTCCRENGIKAEWHQPLFPQAHITWVIGDRDTGHSLLNRVIIVADPESKNRPGISTQEYLSAFIRAQVTNANAEVIREPSSFVSGGSDFYGTDYKRAENGITVYNSMVCAKRNSYWLSWNFATPSQHDLDDAVNTLQHIFFRPCLAALAPGNASYRRSP